MEWFKNLKDSLLTTSWVKENFYNQVSEFMQKRPDVHVEVFDPGRPCEYIVYYIDGNNIKHAEFFNTAVGRLRRVEALKSNNEFKIKWMMQTVLPEMSPIKFPFKIGEDPS